ncbi:cation:proton antiporter [Nostoc spongiaeforme FACHB-130]|uniref:Cation:proton antiporter n=1 Tax=Nostoc spongiaeforme FACHB-130 TaxID=1357510 RepID=A0ABR8FQ26_9NOSO|nr:cation:proton antiporter [Nostoc spongiaeforme]MBD2593282.1 cation:proton antiporter [Nostoc spongiaeforme FACHB-130]
MEPVLSVLAIEPTFHLGQEPIVPLAILLLVILVIPILFERLRIPGLVGLVGSGVVLGPSGWNLVHTDYSIINLLSDIGLIYLMFLVGLEQDFRQLHQSQKQAWGFAWFSFIIPLLMGIFIGKICGWGANTSLFIGCLFSSYTLLAHPILSSLGVINNQAVSTSIKATILTDIGAVLILSIFLSSQPTEAFSLSYILTYLGRLIIYTTIVWVGCDWAGQEFFRRSGDDESNKFLFVLLSVFIALISCQLLGITKIVGAFLAGLAMNAVVGDSPTKEKITFLGSVLFIPVFFVNLGVLINLPAGSNRVTVLELILLGFVSVIVSKFVAALLAKLCDRYNWQEMFTMWSISVPQVSTTLVGTFLGYRAGWLSTEVFLSMVALVLITSTLGVALTDRLAVALTSTPQPEALTVNLPEAKIAEKPSILTIVVPIYNPHTQQYLMEMAALLAQFEKSKIIPLNIATAAAQMDAPQLEASLLRGEQLLAKATDQSLGGKIETVPLVRIDNAYGDGISRAAREQKASLIVMGWGKRTGLRSRLFGNVTDSVLWASHCAVAVTRLVESPQKIQRILVPLENLTSPVLPAVKFAQMLAEANQAQVTVLNVCDRRISASKIAARRSQLTVLVSQLALPNSPEIQMIAHDNIAQAILQAARLYDLVVLPFIRNYHIPGGLVTNDLTTQIAKHLTCSIVILKASENTQVTNISKTIANTSYMI